MADRPLELVVLVSGSGSNLQAVLDAVASGQLFAEVTCVVSNRRRAKALDRAEQAGVSTAYVPLKPYRDAGRPREDYDRDLAQMIRRLAPDLVVCLGWMHLFTPVFLDEVGTRVINLHPALPGQFPGKDGIGDALAAFGRGEVDHSGCMIHEVIPEVDAGPVLATSVVPFEAGDTRETYAPRMHAAEHGLVVDVLRALCEEPGRPSA